MMLQAKNAFLSCVAGLAFALAGPAQAANLLTNGSFSAGLAGWTSFNTANGVSNPSATSFDVTGSGAQSAAGFKVGQVVFPGPGGTPAGGGLSQAVNFGGGSYIFSADWAALGGAGNNGSGGLFSLLVNNSIVASFDSGRITANSVERGSLSFTGTLAAGSHVFAIQATRPFTAVGDTPTQYFSNVSVDGARSVIPEPATWAMMVMGFGMVGFAARKRAGMRTKVSFA
jgi:hypothetical protein